MRGNWASGFPNRFDTNQPVQSQKKARSLKSGIKEEELLYHLCSENKGADQLRSYCEADLRLCFPKGKNLNSHGEAHVKTISTSIKDQLIFNSNLGFFINF